MLQREGECIVITGEYGVGKSVAGVTRYPPSKLSRGFVHDSEGSLNDILYNLAGKELKIGHYVDTRSRFPELETDKMLELINEGKSLPWVSSDQREALVQYYKFVIEDITTNLTKDAYDWVLFDTLEKFEAGTVAWTESNKKTSGYRTDAYGQKWWGAVYPLYNAIFKSIWARGVKSIILTSHVKQAWEGGRPVPGKLRMSGKPLLYLMATSMFWLVKDPRNPRGEPAALVLKSRYGDLGVNTEADTWNPKRLLPPRIPKFTWAEVENYIETGCYDPANPKPGEVLSNAEMDMIAPILSGKQLDLMIEESRLERAQIESQSVVLPGTSSTPLPAGMRDLNDEIVVRIKELRLDNNDSEIREMLKSEGYKVPEVLKAFKSLGGMKG